MGAWIEISGMRDAREGRSVAPLVGAWIEIKIAHRRAAAVSVSLPSWERGLKYVTIRRSTLQRMSLPSWERGLKSDIFFNLVNVWNVAPLVGAWIEIFI